MSQTPETPSAAAEAPAPAAPKDKRPKVRGDVQAVPTAELDAHVGQVVRYACRARDSHGERIARLVAVDAQVVTLSRGAKTFKEPRSSVIGLHVPPQPSPASAALRVYPKG